MAKASTIFAGFGALFGAAGVVEAAAAAHIAANAPLLKTSSEFLLFHAAALVALGAFARTAASGRRILLIGAGAILLGTLLFCGELTSHVFLPHSPFVAMAPIGGTLTIVGWLVAALGIFTGALRSS